MKRCQSPGCITLLSDYNPDALCFAHQPPDLSLIATTVQETRLWKVCPICSSRHRGKAKTGRCRDCSGGQSPERMAEIRAMRSEVSV